MKPPRIPRAFDLQPERNRERGVTMVLVAIAMVAIIAMAALSIDVITLYLAREESQRSADAAALAAARIISISGITGDPQNVSGFWSNVCGPSGTATQAAQAVAAQNAVGGPAPTVTVTYGAGNGSNLSSSTDCSTLAASTAFGVNPIVTVKVGQTSLPTFFSRVWGTTGNSVSATASAEAFNSSNSGNAGNLATGTMIPVQPRCVKPWAVANKDPMNPPPVGSNYCDQSGGPGACQPLVNLSTGAINHPGISTGGSGATGIIGENFWLESDCIHGNASCNPLRATPIQANLPQNGIDFRQEPPNLLYFPNQVGTPVTAIPSCSQGDPYEEAIEGCDSPANYQCGVPNGNTLDLSRNPDSGPVTNGVSCLISQSNTNDTNNASGQDYLAPSSKIGNPNAYPFQVLAGTSNPLVTSTGLSKDTPISASASIVSLPIYDQSTPVTAGATTAVTFVGFLQVFINAVDPYGNINVTVLNVTGCGNDNTPGTAVAGSSPVPVRLITPPSP